MSSDLLGWLCFCAAGFAVYFAGVLAFRERRYGYAFLAVCLAAVLFLDTPPYYLLFGSDGTMTTLLSVAAVFVAIGLAVLGLLALLRDQYMAGAWRLIAAALLVASAVSPNQLHQFASFVIGVTPS